MSASQRRESLTWRFEKAVRDSDLPGLAKAVAWALKSRADEFGWCYPSLGRLAQDAGISRSALAKQLNLLCARGWIYRERGGGRTKTHYCLRIPPVRVADETRPHHPAEQSAALTAAVHATGVSDPFGVPEVDPETDQLERVREEERQARAAASPGASVVRAQIEQSLAADKGRLH